MSQIEPAQRLRCDHCGGWTDDSPEQYLAL